jgi:hypothetical protein
MKNQDQTKLSANDIFPLDVRVKSVKSINYDFEPDKLSPWSSEIVVHSDEYRVITISGSRIFPENGYVDEQFKKFIEMERQLIEDYHSHMVDYYDHVGSIEQTEKPIEEMLQRCAILINSAKCAEDLGFQVHNDLRPTDRELADHQLKFIYKEYVIPCYSMAASILTAIGEKRLSGISDKDKIPWARMLNYAQNKGLSSLILYDDGAVKAHKDFYKRSNKALIENGFANLATDYLSEDAKEDVSQSVSTSILDGAKQLIWSAFNVFYNFNSNTSEHNIEGTKLKEHKFSAADSLIEREVRDDREMIGEQELRRRKINNSPNKL